VSRGWSRERKEGRKGGENKSILATHLIVPITQERKGREAGGHAAEAFSWEEKREKEKLLGFLARKKGKKKGERSTLLEERKGGG